MKQLRSVVETEFSVDDVYDFYIRDDVTKEAEKAAKEHAQSTKLRQSVSSAVEPFCCVQQNVRTKVQYREVPLPW